MEPPTVRETCKKLEAEGWVLSGIRGDHRKYVRGGRHIIVPGKASEHLKKGTYAAFKQAVGWR